MTALWDVYESPFGPLTLTASERGLTGLSFPGRAAPQDERDRRPDALAPAVEQLEQYFAGDRRSFDFALDPAGSVFQHRIWQRLLEIPYGATITYGELADAVGRPDILRGVAAAVGRTPIPIVIPCHRVLASNGALTGYLGGVHRKDALLQFERRGAGGLGPVVEWQTRQLTLL
jgi:methylated-DNA-[protein]-cysteine S-methyltransferase